ncbi:MAG: murI [Bacteroidota bacterium]|jgi:L-alanine-DL-glutamate epimerase-like enolase superfamily enzyme|nr:murI [Bacteroidota bacterium]
MKLSFEPQTLIFRHPFRIAHGMRTTTPIVITQIEHEGLIGFGEASMPPYLGESHESVCTFLELAAPVIKDLKDDFDIEFIMQEMDELALGNTAAKASIDIALHDLKGKLLGIPCYRMFGADKDKTPFSTFTLGIDEPEVIIKKINEADEFKILKVKLNGIDDRMMINTIRNVTDKPIAVDVNQGWKTKEHALKMIEWLAGMNVLFVEQPMLKDDYDSAAWLYERSPLPLYGDESIQRIDDISKVQGCYHGINIKLMKCTGMHEASKMITYARELKLKILIGCMSETSCAVSAAAQLTPFADYADLDGAMLMTNDLFDGIKFIEGKIILNDKPGIGVSLLNGF